MAFTLIQAGTSLYTVNTDGGGGVALTLPANVTLASNRIPRFARFQNYVVVVNTPSRPLSVGTDGTVRVFQLQDHVETVWPEITFQPAGGAPIVTGQHVAGQPVCQCADCLAANPTR